jgi:signal transduction histidine kinase
MRGSQAPATTIDWDPLASVSRSAADAAIDPAGTAPDRIVPRTEMTTIPATDAGLPLAPVRPTAPPGRLLSDELLTLVAAAADVPGGIDQMVTLLMRDGSLAGAEWWTEGGLGQWSRRQGWGDGSRGDRSPLAVGSAGTLILVDPAGDDVEAAIARVVPLLHHRWIGEQLAEQVSKLARENKALDDLAALVAHDVRSTLLCALREDAAGHTLTRGLALVDSILDVARSAESDRMAGAVDCVGQATADLGDIEAQVFSSVDGDAPVPAALRVVLRMLLTNSVAAGGRRIHVSVLSRPFLRLIVDDDGVGLAGGAEYATGSQVGLGLCRRLVSRMGGTLHLEPRAVGGTRAEVLLPEVSR